MHGDGIKLATTPNSEATRLLDVTRLISRAGRVATGIDRVELAYLKHCVEGPDVAFGLARTSLGYVLLNAIGLRALLDRFEEKVSWGSADLISLTSRKKSNDVRRAESDLRKLCIARCLPSRLGRMLRAHLPREIVYLNVGHSNLTDRTLWALRHDVSAHIAVLVHDTIPLDFPQHQKPGTPDLFRAKLKRIQRFADRIIYNSIDTQTRAESYLRSWGEIPEGVVAPLGVNLMAPDPGALPAGLDLKNPYFVTVGTIEPRKNHALLLDVWEHLSDTLPQGDVPKLFICGARGWNNAEVFARLDALPKSGPITELNSLSDAAMHALVQGAAALIFSSVAEGYGLPPIEAAALGTPVICLDLPVYRETLGDIPVYLKAPDRYLLSNLVQSLSKGPKVEQISEPSGGFIPPTWDDHFRLAFMPK